MPLPGRPEEVLASVRGSTAAIDHPMLADWLEAHLAAAVGRADNARQRSVDRSAQIRQCIREAWGDVPIRGCIGPGHIARCRFLLAARNLKADDRTIRAALRERDRSVT